ncbi:MAG: outer membrane protein assembly factor BamE [Gammaproteobacteria bacterium]
MNVSNGFRMRRLFPALLAGAAVAAFAGCVYVPPVTQGNYLQYTKLQQLEVGMTPKQVQYLFGEPMLANPFYPDTWHYVYYYKAGAHSKRYIYRLTVNFDHGKVASFNTSLPTSKAPGSELSNEQATPHAQKGQPKAAPKKPKHPTSPANTGGTGQNPQSGSGA